MKSDFLDRPVNLSREDRIKAHFLTCFITLLIYRILEKKLDYKYTTTQITDDLHELFGFNTDYEIISYKKNKKIFNIIKEKNSTHFFRHNKTLLSL